MPGGPRDLAHPNPWTVSPLGGRGRHPWAPRLSPVSLSRSLLVAEEMRSLIVEKGPGPVEDDPDALVKGGHRGLCPWSSQGWWDYARQWLDPIPEGQGTPAGARQTLPGGADGAADWG